MKTVLLGLAMATCVSCSSGGGGGAAPDSGTGGPDAAVDDDGSQYNTLTGTIVATGVNATLSGSMQGTDNSKTDGMSAWNGVSTFARAVSGLAPPELNVKWSAPAGDTYDVLVNINMEGPLVGGTYNCSLNASGAQANVGFMVHDSKGEAVYNYGTAPTSCTIKLETPVKVVSNGITVYFAHGSLTADISSTLPGAEKPNGTGTMQATW